MSEKQAETWSPKRWERLSPQQRRREFDELVKSPYWDFLPEEIQERVKKLPLNDEEETSQKH